LQFDDDESAPFGAATAALSGGPGKSGYESPDQPLSPTLAIDVDVSPPFLVLWL
jgi:hypothetical protein